MKKIKINFNNLLLNPLAWILILGTPGIFYPLLLSGYYGDDTLSSLVLSTMTLSGQSFIDKTLINFEAMSSRFPSFLQLYFLLFFIIGGNLFYLKLWVLILLVLLLLTQYYLIKRTTGNKSLSLISLIISISLLQFREYGDPILAFYGITPLSLLVLMWSLIFIMKCNDNINKKNILLSNFLIIFSTQLYEFNILIIILFLLILTIKKNNIILIKINLIAIICIIFQIIVAIYLRVNLDNQVNQEFANAYKISNNIIEILRLVLFQVLGVLPFINTIVSNSIKINIYFVFLSIIFSIVILKYFEKKLNLSNYIIQKQYNNLKYLILLILIIPVSLLALSPKYQNEIKFGMVYTPSLYTVIAISLLLTIFFSYIQKSKNIIINNTKYLVLLIIINSFIINIYSNNIIVDSLNKFWHYPRLIAEKSMKAGIFNDIKNNPILISSTNYPWSISPFYYEYSRVKFDQKFYQAAPGMLFFAPAEKPNILVSGIINHKINNELLAEFPYLEKNLSYFDGNYYFFDFDNESRIYYFDYFSNSKKSGYSVLCRIRKLVANQNYISSVLCDSLKIFNINDHEYFSLNGVNISKNSIENFIINHENFNIKTSNSQGKLLIKDNFDKNIFIDPKSIQPLLLSRYKNESIIYNSENSNKIYFKNNLLLLDSFLWDKTSDINISFKLQLGDFFNTFQPIFSHIIGNHPGKGYDGFVFQKKDSSLNEYVFSYGDGNKWVNLALIKLDNNETHKFVLNINSQGVKLFHNNILVGENSYLYSNSNMNVQVGALFPGTRYFNGYIFDFKIWK